MADRPDAYVRKNPGDVIRSSEWNELQVKAREEIRSHRHTGNEDGSLIPRAAIEAGAIDGRLIDAAADVNIRTLTASGSLTVRGDLTVNGKALLGDVADLLAAVKGLQEDKVNRRGDTISGALRVQRLFIDAALGVGTDQPAQQLTITGGLGFGNQNATDKKLYSPKDGLLEWMTHEYAEEHGLAVSHQGEKRVLLNTNGNSYILCGNLGIDTMHPEGKLHLVNLPQDANGNTLILGHTNASNMRLGFHDDYTWIQSHCSRPLALNPIANNVGIGTTAPTHTLHVVAQNDVALFESKSDTTYLRLATREGFENRVEVCNRPGGILSLWNNYQDVLNITRSGNVGIGTSTPSQKLTIQSPHNAGRDPDSGLSRGGQLALKGNELQIDFIDTNPDHNDWAINVHDSKMYFIRAPWSDTNLVLAANGNIGIGTDSPDQQLTITGGLGFGNQNATDKKLYSPKDGLLEWMTHDAAGEHGFAVSHQGQVRVHLNINGNSYLNGGNVGIGTAAPSEKLHVNGNLCVSGDIIRKVSVATALGPDDQTDNGPIASRVLNFVKGYADTAIRIIYCDNFRVIGKNVAARWEIRVNGGIPPGGAIYQDKYGEFGNFHEPGIIMGYARGIAAGVHTIGVWVSTPPGYGVCDAYTGWGSSRWTLEAQEVWL